MSAEAKKPLREVRKAAYRLAILEAAERVFAAHGFEETKMQQVADEAGIAVGTVYNVFESKSDLIDDVLTHRLPELMKRTFQAATEATNTFERLTKGLRSYVIFLLEHPDHLRIHLREHAWGLGPTRTTGEQLEAWLEGLELEVSILTQAIEEGLVIDEDPYVLARCITAMHQVQLWDWVTKGMTESVTNVADRMDRIFLQMFCTPKGQENA